MTDFKASNPFGDWAMAVSPWTPRAGGLVGLVGCLALTGWLLDVEILKSIVPGLQSMNPLTALTFVLAGICLGLVRGDGTRHRRESGFQHASAAFVTLVGVATLAGYALGRNLGLDQLLFSDPLGDDRIAPNTGLNLVLVGGALVLLTVKTRRAHLLAQGLAVVSAMVALFAVVGYVYGSTYLNGFTTYIPMALNTAVAFILLDVGIIAARPGVGLAALATSNTVGALVLRRLLPAALSIPIALGWLRLQGQQADLYDTEFGTAVFAVANAAVFAALIVGLAWQLHRMDTKRQVVEEERDRFFSLSLDPLCIAGLDGYFQRLNPAFSRLLGFTETELLAEPFVSFVHPDDRAATLDEVGKLAAGAPTVGFENRYRCQDGSYRWFVWMAAPAHGQIYAVAHDISERKRMEESLHATNRELEAFSYSVSHDLRAPLRVVDGFSRILVEDYAPHLPDDAKRYLQIVRDGTVQMGQLIDDLLALSRLGRQPLRVRAVQPASVVSVVLDELRPEVESRAVELTVDDLPACRADPALLKQVYVNLLSNALKYTRGREPATIQVGALTETEAPLEQTYFVKDNGVGFDLTYAPKLFGVFQRLHRAEDYEGTGVGLALVQRIIHRHGGQIWAEAAVDEGATFWFTLPAAPANEGADEMRQAAA